MEALYKCTKCGVIRTGDYTAEDGNRSPEKKCPVCKHKGTERVGFAVD